jgi:hypothetical protein
VPPIARVRPGHRKMVRITDPHQDKPVLIVRTGDVVAARALGFYQAVGRRLAWPGRPAMSATLEIVPSVLDRIRRTLVGLKMPRALEVLDQTMRQLERGEASALEVIDTLFAEELRCARTDASRWRFVWPSSRQSRPSLASTSRSSPPSTATAFSPLPSSTSSTATR